MPELQAMRSAVRMLMTQLGERWQTHLVMVDVGAGLGLRSVAALARYQFARVVASERDEGRARLLRANARLNDCLDRLDVVPELEIATLDRLAHEGAYDPATVGLIWFGADEPVLEALSSADELLDRGTPIVVEMDATRRSPTTRQALVDALDGRYTHATVIGRTVGATRPVGRLPRGDLSVGSHVLLSRSDLTD